MGKQPMFRFTQFYGCFYKQLELPLMKAIQFNHTHIIEDILR